MSENTRAAGPEPPSIHPSTGLQFYASMGYTQISKGLLLICICNHYDQEISSRGPFGYCHTRNTIDPRIHDTHNAFPSHLLSQCRTRNSLVLHDKQHYLTFSPHSFLIYRTIMYSNGYVYSSSSSSRASGSKKMPPGVPHPQAGMQLSPYTARCECGGITGICGTAKGASKWRSHQSTQKHMDWDPIYNM